MEHQVPAAVALTTSTHAGGGKDEALGMARYAGTLILKELALNMPGQFIGHLPSVLDGAVLAPLRDPRLVVREAAAELLAACLEIGAQRERSVQGGNTAAPPAYLGKILQDAQLGLKFTQPEVIHGSLLTYRELLLHAGAVRVRSLLYSFKLADMRPQFMRDNFPETAESILAFRANRDPAVRRMVVAMIPTLASYNTPAFKELVLHKAMAHLLGQLEKKEERDYGMCFRRRN